MGPRPKPTEAIAQREPLVNRRHSAGTSDNRLRYVTVGEAAAESRRGKAGRVRLLCITVLLSDGPAYWQNPLPRRVPPGSDRNRAKNRRWLLLMAVTG